MFHLWRENTRVRVDEAKKTHQAGAHYRRTVISKVTHGEAAGHLGGFRIVFLRGAGTRDVS